MSELASREMVEYTSGVYIDPGARDIIVDPGKVVLLALTPDGRFERRTTAHGRNMEDPLGLVLKPDTELVNTTTYDQDIYSTFSIKGADASDPRVSYIPTEPNQVRVNGMMDASVFERIKKASGLLRDDGVLTEWPIFHARPKTFPLGEQNVGLQAFRRGLYDRYRTEAQAIRDDPETRHKAKTIHEVAQVGLGLSDMEFGVLYRATMSGIRLGEIRALNDTGMISPHIADAIRSLQKRDVDYFDYPPDIDSLDPDALDDQKRYITQMLPNLMGSNLARFHGLDCYHKYLHPGNWTLAGEIVDLDSVRSTKIDPEEVVTFEERMADVFGSILAIEALEELYARDSIPNDTGGQRYLLSEFFTSYFAERNTQAGVEQIEQLIIESHLCPPPPDYGSASLPMLVDINDPEFASLMRKLVLLSPDPAMSPTYGQITTTMRRAGITDHIREKMNDYLVRHNFDQSLWWFSPEDVIQFEITNILGVIHRSQVNAFL